MNWLTKIFLNSSFASQFQKPKGFLGMLVSKLMKDNNFFVYTGIEEFADISDNQYVLEIGYGPGMGINYFLSKYNIIFDGIDFSRLMYKQATSLNKKYIAKGVLDLYHTDFATFKCNDEQYDRIIFANVIYFWKNLDQVFNKIYRLLRANGKLVFYMSDKKLLDTNKVTANPIFIKYTAEEVRSALENANFKQIVFNSIINDKNEFLVVCAEKSNS